MRYAESWPYCSSRKIAKLVDAQPRRADAAVWPIAAAMSIRRLHPVAAAAKSAMIRDHPIAGTAPAPREESMRTKLVATLAAAVLCAGPALAQDVLKVAVPQRGAWDAGLAELGQRGGIFKKHGLTLEVLYTQ